MKTVLTMAPIMGFGTALYRNLFAQYFNGFDVAVAPFIPSTGSGKLRNKYMNDVLPENNWGIPVIPQILSNDPEGFILLAQKLFDLGYDTVNWNVGCPFPAVANKKRGSGLLPHPEMIQHILDKVLPQIPNKLSVKARIGRQNEFEIFDLLPVFNAYPITELIVHPRTGIQMYKGDANPDVFEALISKTHIPLTYNGDINDRETYLALSKRFPSIKRFMIGRGAISDPFLPGDIKHRPENKADRVRYFKKFHDDLLAGYSDTLDGPSHVLSRMKGYWSFFYLSFQDGHKVFKKIKKINKLDKFIATLDRFFDEDAVWIK